MRVAYVFAVALLVASLLSPSNALAQRATPPDPATRVYVVQPGDTLLRVANRLGVEPRDLAARNSLPRPYTLTVGRRLRLPQGVNPAVLATLPTRDEASNADGAQGAHRPGFVSMTRLRDGAQIATSFAANSQTLRTRVARFLRARDNREHIVHPRLMRTLQVMSDRYGGRTIEVLSGYRPARAGVPISHHSRGEAVDLRVEGVALRDVWTFCQSLRNLGCGLYLRGNYVHLDVRAEGFAWQGPPRRGATQGSPLDPDPDEDPAVVAADAAAAQ